MAVYMTQILEPVLRPVARQLGVSEEEFIPYIGGEIVGNGVELVTNVFAKGWLSKLAQFIAGVIAAGYAAYGRPDARLRRELAAFGTHELLRVIQLTPSEIKEVSESVANTVNALKRGDINAVMESVIRPPEEIQQMVDNILGILGLKKTAQPTATTAAAPVVVVPAPAPAPAPSYEHYGYGGGEIY